VIESVIKFIMRRDNSFSSPKTSPKQNHFNIPGYDPTAVDEEEIQKYMEYEVLILFILIALFRILYKKFKKVDLSKD
jgi:hypothetical protein